MENINTKGLLEPQIPHVKKLVDSLYLNGHAVDMSDTGTGKMFCASAVARELNVPSIVIAPKSIIPQWKSVIKLFDIKPLEVINYEKLVRGNTKWMKWKRMENPEYDHNGRSRKSAMTDVPVFNLPPHALVIVDEAHKCKGIDTSNSWMLIALKLQGYKVLISSATAAASPLDMKAFGFVTNMHSLYNYSSFCLQFGAEWTGRFGTMTWNADKQSAKMREAHDYLQNITSCASRLTVDMFGDLFPQSQIVAEAFSLGANEKKLQKVYEDMEYEIARLEERAENYSQHIFAIMMRARRLAELVKVPLFVEMIKDLYDEKKSVVIFVNFEDTASGIHKRLIKMIDPDQIGFIVGGQSDKVRQADIDAFNADKKRVLIVNIAAGGTGISLHDLNGNYPRASIVSPTWSAFSMKQALGRIYRTGAKSRVYQRIVYGAGCIEESICKRVQEKLNNLDTLNDGDVDIANQFFA
jgi:superfamily II DNA or RNA helicase